MAKLTTPAGAGREVKFAYWKDRHRTTLAGDVTAYTTGTPGPAEESLPTDFTSRVVNARYNPVMRRNFERWLSTSEVERRSGAVAPITFDAVASFTQRPAEVQKAQPVVEDAVEDKVQPVEAVEVEEDVPAASEELGAVDDFAEEPIEDDE